MEVKFKEMNAIMAAMDALYHEAARRLGIPDADFYILYALVEAKGIIPQKDLYKESGMARSTINSAVKKMERNEILTLDSLDGRSTIVRLTSKGRQLSRDTVEKVIGIENKIYDEWTEEEKQTAIKLNRDFMDKFALEVGRL